MTSFLDADRLRRGCAGTRWRVEVVATTGSTNADLAAAAREGAASGAVLVSAHQSEGRGRFDRRWTAPPDTSVAVSVLVRPSVPLDRWGWLSALAGMAVTDALRLVGGLDAGLKWPNDVLVGGRKICGILSEAVPTDAGMAAVVGMGINVALTSADLPVPTATSVVLEGSDAPAADLVAGVLAAFDRWYAVWDAGEPIADAYRQRCVTIGQQVNVHLGDHEIVTGLAMGVDDRACLVVATDDGESTFAAGDVEHLRRR